MADLLSMIKADAREVLSWWWRAICIVAPWWLAAVVILSIAQLVWLGVRDGR